MNSKTSLEEREPGMSFEEKIDILFHEIDLAIKWSRPSILFAVYNSGTILSKAKAELEDRLSNLHQRTHIVEISGKKQSNFSAEIFKLPQLSRSVLFIDDINCNPGEESSGFFKELKWNLEKFIDHQIKVIFWLAEDEVPLFATNAIECWILRHRVVEFQDSPYQTTALMQTLESTWQDMDDNALENPGSALAIQEILLAPEKVEPNYFHGNLILMLGVLYWRKGNSQDAERFLNAALGIARNISHPKLAAQCTNALALVQSDPQKTDDPSTAAGQEAPVSSEIDGGPVKIEEPAVVPEAPVSSAIECSPVKIEELATVPEAPVSSATDCSPVKFGEPAAVPEEPEPAGTGEELAVSIPEEKERGMEMKESDQTFDQKTPAEWNEMGNKFLRAGSYNDAINAFTKAIEMAPEISWPYIRNLASAHYHKGKIKGKTTFGKTEEPDVWEGEDDEAEAIVYFNQDDIPDAKRGDAVEGEDDQALEPSLKAGPVSTAPAAASPSGMAARVAGSIDARPQPAEPPSPAPLSVVRAAQDKLAAAAAPAAVEALNNIPEVSAGPQSPYEWNQLGNSFTNSRNFEKAIAAYKKSIELNPRFGQPYSNLGSVLYQIGKYQNAILLLQKSLEYLETPEEKALSWNRLGDAYRRMRDYGNALAAYQKASQLNPDTNPVLTRARLSLMDSVAVG